MNTPRKALLMTTLLVSTLGWGQQPITFNVAHTNAIGSFAVGKSVYEVADGYLVFSQQKGVLGGLQNPFVTKFDLQGQLVWEREYVHSRYVNYGIVDPVARLAGGGYASGISVFGAGSPIDSLFLFRFDEEGDTLWTRFLIADTTVTIRKCIETANGDLVLTGLYQYPSGAYIYRLTADGDSVVFKNLGAPVFDSGSISEDADGNFYLTGFGQDAALGHNNNAFIVKVDANGTFVWRRHWPRISAYSQAIPTSDGGVLAIGAFSEPIPVWPQFEPTRALLAKYSSTGVLLWSSYPIQADQHNRYCTFEDGFEQPDGNLVVCGIYRSNATLDRGMLFKFTAEGDELWRRFYRWYDGPFNGNEQIFNDVEPTSDGGFILTGSTERFVDTTYTHPAKLWLVKLDSMGCLVPGCHTVGIEEQALDLNQYLRIWPNPLPAGQAVQFSFEPPPTFTLNGPLRAALLDGAGRIVHEERVQVGTGQLANLSLAAGLYYLHLTDGTMPSAGRPRWLAGGKVLVE
jgi:hypothetical protein